jgi:hypothetical protein
MQRWKYNFVEVSGILWFQPSFLLFYKMVFMNKLEFSSLINCLEWISETIRVLWFSTRFSPLNAFLIVVSMEKMPLYMYKIKCKKRKNNAVSKINKEIM